MDAEYSVERPSPAFLSYICDNFFYMNPPAALWRPAFHVPGGTRKHSAFLSAPYAYTIDLQCAQTVKALGDSFFVS